MDVACDIRSMMTSPSRQQLKPGCGGGALLPRSIQLSSPADVLGDRTSSSTPASASSPAAAAASEQHDKDGTNNDVVHEHAEGCDRRHAPRCGCGSGAGDDPAGCSHVTSCEHVTEVKVEGAEDEDDSSPVKSDIVNGWFMEWIDFSCGGHAQCLKVDQVLFHQQSQFQDILVFKSETFGNVLVLDGIINCTERDEFSYQEMLAHLALCSHPNPQSVLIIGGGDGGVAREVAKHDVVKTIVQCEIDEMVVSVCKKYVPSMSRGFTDPRVQLIIGDGFEFLDQHIEQFDVIITDSSDPEGPAESLFGKDYYDKLYRALKPNGLVISQGQTMWIPMEVEAIVPLLNELREIFPVVNYSYTFIPTYTMGQIGFILASKNPATVFREPLRPLSEDQLTAMKLRYYNSDIHRASFVMPQFISKVLPV